MQHQTNATETTGTVTGRPSPANRLWHTPDHPSPLLAQATARPGFRSRRDRWEADPRPSAPMTPTGASPATRRKLGYMLSCSRSQYNSDVDPTQGGAPRAGAPASCELRHGSGAPPLGWRAGHSARGGLPRGRTAPPRQLDADAAQPLHQRGGVPGSEPGCAEGHPGADKRGWPDARECCIPPAEVQAGAAAPGWPERVAAFA